MASSSPNPPPPPRQGQSVPLIPASALRRLSLVTAATVVIVPPFLFYAYGELLRKSYTKISLERLSEGSSSSSYPPPPPDQESENGEEKEKASKPKYVTTRLPNILATTQLGTSNWKPTPSPNPNSYEPLFEPENPTTQVVHNPHVYYAQVPRLSLLREAKEVALRERLKAGMGGEDSMRVNIKAIPDQEAEKYLNEAWAQVFLASPLMRLESKITRLFSWRKRKPESESPTTTTPTLAASLAPSLSGPSVRNAPLDEKAGDFGARGFYPSQSILNGISRVVRPPTPFPPLPPASLTPPPSSTESQPLVLSWQMPIGPVLMFEKLAKTIHYPFRLQSGGRHVLDVAEMDFRKGLGRDIRNQGGWDQRRAHGAADMASLIKVGFGSAHHYERWNLGGKRPNPLTSGDGVSMDGFETVPEGAVEDRKRIPKWVEWCHETYALLALSSAVGELKRRSQDYLGWDGVEVAQAYLYQANNPSE